MKKAAKAVKEREKLMTLNSPPVDHKAYRQAEKSRMLDDAIRLGHERWKIEEFYGRDISEVLLDEWNASGAARLTRLIDLFRPIDDLIERYRKEVPEDERRRIPLQQRALVFLRSRLIRRLLQSVYGQGLLDFEAIPKDEFMARLKDFNAIYERENADRVFNRRGRKSETPLARLRYILSLAGMRLNMIRVGREKAVMYELDFSRFGQLTALAVTHMQHRQDTAFKSVCTRFAIIYKSKGQIWYAGQNDNLGPEQVA